MASSEALSHLYWAMHAVSYHCIAIAIKMASKVGVLIVVLLIVALVDAGVIRSK